MTAFPDYYLSIVTIRMGREYSVLKNMKIGKKLISAFLLVTIITSIGGVIGFCVLTTMVHQYSGALVNYGFAQGDVGLFDAEFNNDRALIRGVIIYTDSTKLQETKKKIDQSKANLNQYLAKMKSEMVTDKEVSYYNTLKSSIDNYIPIQDQIVDLAVANKKSDANTLGMQKCDPLCNKVTAAIDTLVQEKTSAGNQVSSSLSEQAETSEKIMIGVLVLSITLSIFIAVLIARGISRPVSELVQVAKKLADGDLSAKVTVNSKDEIGQLGDAFRETIETLNRYITDINVKLAQVEKGDLTITKDFEYKGDFVQLIKSIGGIVQFMNDTIAGMREASEQVASGSEQVSSGAQALAQGATEQASSTEELAASITEISSQVKENAGHVTKASKNMDQVTSEMETCNQQMQQMIQAMSKINDSSNQIRKIIKTIEDIAFQTNILALNAAVEAARAGDAGKGFAVVADEVRNLASKSAEAAKSTTVLIQNSTNEVENGSKIADETAKSLLRVVESAKVVSDTVEHISLATTKQSNAIQQINTGVEQISSVVQTNSATAEESAAASEELSGQAQTMRTLAAKFKLRSANTAS
ncbi:MAG TPA: methyl-accepting chemotaxis protein [Ruminococcaceae bacterium]|nr:methyl-accepting chemotaxis protein [Oscillospiraceae bacterium]